MIAFKLTDLTAYFTAGLACNEWIRKIKQHYFVYLNIQEKERKVSSEL